MAGKPTFEAATLVGTIGEMQIRTLRVEMMPDNACRVPGLNGYFHTFYNRFISTHIIMVCMFVPDDSLSGLQQDRSGSIKRRILNGAGAHIYIMDTDDISGSVDAMIYALGRPMYKFIHKWMAPTARARLYKLTQRRVCEYEKLEGTAGVTEDSDDEPDYY